MPFKTTLKAAAKHYLAKVTESAAESNLAVWSGWDIEQAFRAGWGASTTNRWAPPKQRRKRRTVGKSEGTK